jgi:COP9 signalosome complex subunit 1
VFGSIKPTMIISGTPIENVRNQMRIRLGRKEYQQALVTINKSTLATSDDRVTAGPLEALKGLCYLGLGRYGEATKHFLRSQMSPAAAAAASSQLENEARNGASSEAAEVLTQNDVAVYGGLLSLATKDRLALQTEVLDNQTFRPFMAIEPHIRRAITLFVGCRYAACLELLESYRTEYLLDMHLQPHVDVLLSRIRIKCMTQFCRPFKTVSLATLRDHFRTPASDLEEELAAMIGNGDLPHARLDVMSGVSLRRVFTGGSVLCATWHRPLARAPWLTDLAVP